MPTYDYLCEKCELIEVHFAKYEDRDKPQTCPQCDGPTTRVYATAPEVRTAKLSASFLDKTTAGGGRPKSDDYDSFKRVAKLQEDLLKYKPMSEDYKQTKKEIKELTKLKK